MEIVVDGAILMARMVSDDRSRENLMALPGLVKRAVVAHGCSGVFIDMTALDGPIDPVDRIFLASRLAEVWPAGVRLAALALPHQVNRVIENIASSRGVQVRAFTDRDEALAWLSPPPAAAR